MQIFSIKFLIVLILPYLISYFSALLLGGAVLLLSGSHRNGNGLSAVCANRLTIYYDYEIYNPCRGSGDRAV